MRLDESGASIKKCRDIVGVDDFCTIAATNTCRGTPKFWIRNSISVVNVEFSFFGRGKTNLRGGGGIASKLDGQ